MDNIKIKKLDVFAKHGVYKEENVLGRNSYFQLCCILILQRLASAMSSRIR